MEVPIAFEIRLGLIAGPERAREIAIGFGSDTSLVDAVAFEHTYAVIF